MKAPIIVTAIINTRVEPHVVTGIFDNNVPVPLFDYYSNELSFTNEELVGLTRTQAIRLKLTKDVAYLQAS